MVLKLPIMLKRGKIGNSEVVKIRTAIVVLNPDILLKVKAVQQEERCVISVG